MAMARTGTNAGTSGALRRRRRIADDADDEEDEKALHPALQWDLDAVRWLVRQREHSPALEGLLIATTSRFRSQDISLSLWLVAIAMLPDLGFPYLWSCVGNLLAVVLLQWLAQVPRPVDLDASLLLRTCTDPDTSGFPCVDAHMAVVVLLPVVENTSSWVAQTAFVLLGAYVSVVKLCLGARFVSQVVGSWLTGLTGVIIANHGHVMVRAAKLPRGYNTAAIVALIAFLMFVIGQWVENNDSRLIGVPKQDFMDVLTNILQSDAAPATTTTSEPVTTSTPSGGSAGGGPARVHQLPMGRSGRHDGTDDAASSAASEEQELMGRKDSFYYLLKGMRTRSRQLGTSGDRGRSRNF